jgi:hypothetical protein
MILTTYYAKTGQIIGTMVVSDQNTIPKNIQYVQGRYDGNEFYIKGGKAVKYPTKPYNNSWIQYFWNFSTEQWLVNEAATSIAARKIRDDKLLAVDRINPIWWEAMSEQERVEARAYRSELLNVPEQEGFPITINWPIKPSWL